MKHWNLLFILLLIYSSGFTQVERAGKDRALLFAVNDYQHMTDLQNPIKNARDIARELENRYGFEAEVVPNPTFEEIEKKILEYQKAYAQGKYTADGQLFVFFSGHGIKRGNNGYFMPADGDSNRPYAKGVEYDFWRAEIDAINCKRILVAVDACHSITFDPNWASKTDRRFNRPGEAYSDQVLLNHEQYRARLFFTSDAKGDQTPDRSTFAQQLLEGFRVHYSRNGYLTSSELFGSYMKKAAPTPGGGSFGADEAGSCFLFFNQSMPKPPAELNDNIEGTTIKNENPTIDIRQEEETIFQGIIKNRQELYYTSATFHPFDDLSYVVDGMLVRTPEGVKANGTLYWKKGGLQSDQLSFGAFSVVADSAEINIKHKDIDIAKISNISVQIDFENNISRLESNEKLITTQLINLNCKVNSSSVDWDLSNDILHFGAASDKLVTLLLNTSNMKSLEVKGTDLLYNLTENEMILKGVSSLPIGEYLIFPKDQQLVISSNGWIEELQDAKLIIGGDNYDGHIIYDATIQVRGIDDISYDGVYYHNIGNKQQEVSVSRGVHLHYNSADLSKSKAGWVTKARVSYNDSFLISKDLAFNGDIEFESSGSNLHFKGHAKILADKLPSKYWISIDTEIDENDPVIMLESPVNYNNEPLRAGFYLSEETALAYSLFFEPKFFRDDRRLMKAQGFLRVDHEKDRYLVGSKEKINGENQKGNIIIYDNINASLTGEGTINISSKIKYVEVDAAGKIRTEYTKKRKPFEELPKVGQGDQSSVELKLPSIADRAPLEMDLMTGVKLLLPKKIMDVMIKDFTYIKKSLPAIDYNKDPQFYKNAITELFSSAISGNKGLGQNVRSIVENNDYTFLFSKLNLKWVSDYQSFVSVNNSAELLSVNGELLERQIYCNAEFKMPTNDDDRLYLYLKSSSGLYYYFGFKQGILSVTSNNPRFMEMVDSLKVKDRIIEMDDGETYEIQPVDVYNANLFIKRIEATR